MRFWEVFKLFRSVWVCSALSLCVGAWLCSFPIGINAFHIIGVAVALLIAGLVFLRTYRVNVVASCVMLCVGFFYYGYVESPNNRSASEALDNFATVEGRIATTPYFKNELYHYDVDAKKVTYSNNSVAVNDRIRVTSKNKYYFGDTVAFEGFLKAYDRERTSKGFDARLFYESRGTYFHLYSVEDKLSNIQIGKNLSYYINYLKNKINVTALSLYKGDEGAVVCAILTGNKSFISDEVSSRMSKTGTKRYLYSAHIHLVLITLCVLTLTKKLLKRTKNIIFVGVFAIFALLSSDNPTFLKTFIMAAMCTTWLMVFKLSPRSDIISACVIFCGLVNPLVLTDTGFIISIASSIIIASSYGKLKNALERKLKCRIPNIVLLWFIVTIVISPLSVRLFGTASLYSFLLTGMYTLIVGATYILAPIGLLFGFKVTLLPKLALLIPRWISNLPLAQILLPRPSVLFLIGFYSLFFALLYYNRRKTRIYLLSVCVVAVCSSVILAIQAYNRVQFHFVDVGQADAEVIRLPYRATILIDGGGSESYSSYDVGEYDYLPYLLGSGITHADAIVVSHYHKDHVQGVISALRNIRVDNIYMPYTALEDEYHKEILRVAKENDTKVVYINNKQTIKIGGIVLHFYPPTKAYDDENDSSLVLKASYGDISVLYAGDITKTRELDLVGEGVDLSANILKCPHHGSSESSSTEFISTVKPELVVYEAGQNNTFGFPTNEACENALNVGARLLSTSSQGDIIIGANKNKINNVKYWGEDFGKGK